MTAELYIMGARSAMVAEIEETLLRCERVLDGIVRLSSASGRLVQSEKLVSLEAVTGRLHDAEFVVGAFTPGRRVEIAEDALKIGMRPTPAIVDPSSTVARSSRVGDGSYINAQVSIGSMSFLGDHVFVNRSVSIGHHCLIEDFVSVAPGVTIAGNIRIGAGTVVGVGATIFPGVKIGRGVIVSGGSVVRKSVPDNTLVSGNPATAKKYDPARNSILREERE